MEKWWEKRFNRVERNQTSMHNFTFQFAIGISIQSNKIERCKLTSYFIGKLVCYATTCSLQESALRAYHKKTLWNAVVFHSWLLSIDFVYFHPTFYKLNNNNKIKSIRWDAVLLFVFVIKLNCQWFE